MAGSLRFSRIGAMGAAAVFVLLSGCGTTVKLADTRLPDALVEPLPLTAGLRLGENIESFVYEETLPTGGTYTIDLGRASALMFGDTLEDMKIRARDANIHRFPFPEARASSHFAAKVPELSNFWTRWLFTSAT